MTLATRLQSLIPDRGFNVAEVAQLAGMPRQALHRIVSGETPGPTLPILQRIANAMGLTVSELLEGVDGKETE